MGTLQSFTALKRDAHKEPLAWQLHLDRLVLAVEAEIRWLDLVEERLATTDQTRTTTASTTTDSPNSPDEAARNGQRSPR